uniref:DNA-directed RNA polymerase subunit Rpo3 n=1 Tax=uncultured marine group II/III euryarchaeote KM3_182_B06 TaxID=1457946 RepID=A0A075GMV4_9EURY|nr:DNA-directed RNA polymerase subunit D (rpoD) [uncultured marine group II/III euryarchaeote KM3_182_B06]
MVKTKILSETDTHLEMLISGTDRAQINAIRRTMLTEVAKMAIHKVRFEMGTINDNATGEAFESVSAIPDEVIAHRLAMIPIPTYHDEFCFLEEDPANEGLPKEEWGSPGSQIIYHCSARGTPEGHTVTAADLNVLGEDKLQIPEAYQNIPITKLFEGQYLEFYAYAVLGRGSEHAKWTPVAGVTFVPRQVAKLNIKTKAKTLWDLDLTITEKDFKSGKLDDIEKVTLLKKELMHVGDGTARKDNFKDAITLEDVPGEFIFKFDTDGSMSARTAFNQACNVLAGRFGNLSGILGEIL